jgi:HK97 family phage prohead protease
MTLQTHKQDLNLRAAFAPTTYDEKDRSVEIVWTTGSQVKRYDWERDSYYMEQLEVSNDAIDFERLNAGAPVLSNHDAYSLNSVIGVVDRAWVENGEGKAKIRFSEREEVKAIIADVKDGILRNISVGYRVDNYEITESNNESLPIYTAKRWTPMEISLVTIPADSGAQVRSEKADLKQPTEEKTEMAKETEQRAEVETTAPVIDVDQVRTDAIKAERQRVADITQAATRGKMDAKFTQRMIDEGKSVDEVRALVLEELAKRDEAAPTQTAHIEMGADSKDKFIEQGVQALRAKAGFEKMEGGNEFRGMRLTEVARMCLDRAGVAHRSMSELELVKRAFTTSTSDFPILLENAMHKTLQAAYANAPDTWNRFCATGSVTDFRAHNRYRTGSFGNLDALGELAEYQNKSIPDGEKESITASTKGNIINISRQTIINDDLGAFMGLANMLGRAARRTIEADVYTLLASNPTMSDGIALFHASHGNLAGSGAAPAIATVEAARIAMAIQTDVSGNDYLDLRPSVFVGGMATGSTAREVNSTEYNDESNKNQRKPNVVRGLFRDIVDTPRISGNEWYLFADSMDAPVIEVAFLNGEQAPFLDSMEGFNVDGLQWKVRLDYGVAAVDWRGAYKNPGA